MVTNDSNKFHNALRSVYRTETGKLVLETLEDMYVNSISFKGDCTNTTMYRLGQKELVQGLMADAKKEEQVIQMADNNSNLELI